MKKTWEPTEESFNLFLSWLAADRDEAAKKYEALRRRLIQLFQNRGCPVAEDLTDQTFDRVMQRLPLIIGNYVGAPAAYIHGTAHHVFLDYLKTRGEPLPDQLAEQARAPADEAEEAERVDACLERCLARLTPVNRVLVVGYYQENKQAKIDHRKQLAAQFELTATALRLRVHRLRAWLQTCIENCLANRADTDPPEKSP